MDSRDSWKRMCGGEGSHQYANSGNTCISSVRGTRAREPKQHLSSETREIDVTTFS